MKPKFLTLTLTAILGFGTISFVSLATPTDAIAQPRSTAKSIVDQAIKDGIIGETSSGYLALVTGAADPKIVNAMNEINIGRKSLYTAKAREESVPLDQVAALFGEKQLAAAKPGEKILTPQGRWATK